MLTSFQKNWHSLSPGQRAALGAMLAVVIGGIVWVAQVAGRPTYGVLFSNLEPEDAGAVTSKLRELKVDYRLSESGRAIEVPADKVYDLRLNMATEGLPRGGSVGFELFDKTNFAATDFTQHLNYQRALQGELTRTINALEGVAESRIHLAMPEKELFADKEEPVTASVVLHLRPGYQMDERGVAGIVHLVSHAVEGLKPQNVTVFNSQGEMLSSGGTGSMHADSQVQLQEQYERRLETELQRLVEKVLGPGRAAIQVSADLNWDQSEITSETYRPSGLKGQNLPVEEQATRETYGRGGVATARGIPGVPSNLTIPPATVGSAGESGQYINTHINNRYAVDKIMERRIAAPGKIRRLSIAVLMDQTVGPAQQQALKGVLAAAAGLDLQPAAKGGRGDRIELLPMAFDRSAVTEATHAAETSEKQGFRLQLVRNGAAVLVVILVMIASLLVARRLLAPPRESFDTLISEPVHGQMPPTYSPQSHTLRRGEQHLTVTADSGSTSERVRQMAADKPDEVARQLKVWMTE